MVPVSLIAVAVGFLMTAQHLVCACVHATAALIVWP